MLQRASRACQSICRLPLPLHSGFTLVIAVISLGSLVAGCFLACGPKFMEQTPNVWPWSGVFGYVLIATSFPIAIIFMSIHFLSFYKTPWPREVEKIEKYGRAIIFFVYGFLIVGGLVICVICMIKPTATEFGPLPGQMDVFTRFCGFFFIVILGPYAILAFLLGIFSIINTSPSKLKQEFSTTKGESEIYNKYGRSSTPSPAAVRVKRRLLDLMIISGYGIIFIPFMIMLSAVFQPIWNIPSRFYYKSFYSPLDWVLNIQLDVYMFKIYPDVLAYWGFIYVLIISGLIVSRVKFLRTIFHFRFRLIPKNKFTTWMLVTSPGEIFVVLLFAALLVWWWWYWFFFYCDCGPNGTGRIAHLAPLERWSRAMGHMCNIVTSLLALPVARNSVWTRVFGIGWEKIIKYHRWLGISMVFFVALHMFLWWARWIQNGTWPHDVYSNQPYIEPFGDRPHFDNFMMPILLCTFIGMVIMAALAMEYVRRRAFEYFYYAHTFALVIFFVSLSHAWNLWFFLSASLALYFVDRLIRFTRGTYVFELASCAVTSEVTSLKFKCVAPTTSFDFVAGQFCFLNIPKLSLLQWHPFSISAAPKDEYISFNIKNMNNKEWTGQLHELAQRSLSYNETFQCNIDGPYGNPLNPAHYRRIFLIAGGIGITPMISIFRHLYKQKRAGYSLGKLMRVELWWVCRDPTLFSLFHDTLDESKKYPLNDCFTWSLYASRDAELSDNSLLTHDLNYTVGRPDLLALLANSQQESRMQYKDSDIAVFACGPDPLMYNVSSSCLELSLDFHEETFYL